MAIKKSPLHSWKVLALTATTFYPKKKKKQPQGCGLDLAYLTEIRQ